MKDILEVETRMSNKLIKGIPTFRTIKGQSVSFCNEVQKQTEQLNKTADILIDYILAVDNLPPLTAIAGVLESQYIEAVAFLEEITGLSWDEIKAIKESDNG